jgi:predicted N-acyltransferase
MESDNRGNRETAGAAPDDYVTRVFESPARVPAAAWDALLEREADPSPFLRHAYLAALHESGCARPAAGWQPRFVTLWRGETLEAACPLYLKNHSYGEYVFDWAWANAYEQHGRSYYPKALVAVPFTPVPGARLLARDDAARAALLQDLLRFAQEEDLSSLHLLYLQPPDVRACEAAGLMLRHTVQFHWENEAPTLLRDAGRCPPGGREFSLGRPGAEFKAPTLPRDAGCCPPGGREFSLGRPGAEFKASTLPAAQGWRDFEHFLASLQQDKRKKIRQERRKVAEAGVVFRHAQGADIAESDWDFFYRCYERTYLEHGNPPYLNRAFFARMARDMPENWLLFVAERDGRPLASSLIGLDPGRGVAYGRYWGALERVDCLHFEACYYQPLQWCIEHGYRRFEGGAQGEHKMARALLPVRTTSAHWLAHPAFADAVQRFLAREGEGIDSYLEQLAHRSPLRAPG